MKINPLQGDISLFGVHSASNTDYHVKANYEKYETNLKKKLAVKATEQLFQSVGLVSSSTISCAN